MTKAELVEKWALVQRPTLVHGRLTRKYGEAMLDGAFALVAKAVISDGRFWWPGFGTFVLRSRKSRRIRNPQTNDIMRLPKQWSVGFRAAKELKARIR